MGPKRAPKVTEKQLASLLEFMEAHEELVTGKFSVNFTKPMAQKLWEELTLKLNSEGTAPNKDAAGWKRKWIEWKSDTKSKAAQAKRKPTGGGPRPKEIELTDVEGRLMALIGPICVEGDAEINEAGFDNTDAFLLRSNQSSPQVQPSPVSANVEQLQPSTSTAEELQPSSPLVNVEPLPSTSNTEEFIGSIGNFLFSVNESVEVGSQLTPPIDLDPRSSTKRPASQEKRPTKKSRSESEHYAKASETIKEIENEKIELLRQIASGINRIADAVCQFVNSKK